MEFRAAAPAPVTRVNGKWPATVATARHHDGPQTDAGCLRDRLELAGTLPLQFVGELYDQDAIFRDQANQCHQTYLRVDIERSGPAFCEEFSEWHL